MRVRVYHAYRARASSAGPGVAGGQQGCAWAVAPSPGEHYRRRSQWPGARPADRSICTGSRARAGGAPGSVGGRRGPGDPGRGNLRLSCRSGGVRRSTQIRGLSAIAKPFPGRGRRGSGWLDPRARGSSRPPACSESADVRRSRLVHRGLRRVAEPPAAPPSPIRRPPALDGFFPSDLCSRPSQEAGLAVRQWPRRRNVGRVGAVRSPGRPMRTSYIWHARLRHPPGTWQTDSPFHC